MARPSLYTPELITTIAERLSNGEPMAVICREAEMPSVTTMWEWMHRHPEVSEVIARAREAGFDQIAAQCLDIAEDGTRDYTIGENGVLVNHDHIQRSKLRVDTRLKLLAKWDPKRYGDKVQHANSDGGELPANQITAIHIHGVAPKASE